MHELTGSVVAGWVHAGGGSRMGKVRRVAGISGGLPPDGMQEVSGSSPLSSTQVRRRIRTQNRCAFPSERHSEGQDPPEAGRLTSDDAELVSPPRPTALSRRSRGHWLRQGGLPGAQLPAVCGTLTWYLVQPGEWWSRGAWAAVI
jgi:hypothetical protein